MVRLLFFASAWAEALFDLLSHLTPFSVRDVA
jgi:hypothetical protein